MFGLWFNIPLNNLFNQKNVGEVVEPGLWVCSLTSSGKYVQSCNIYPLIPHFYIAKLEYAGVYNHIFLIILQNIDCGYS